MNRTDIIRPMSLCVQPTLYTCSRKKYAWKSFQQNELWNSDDFKPTDQPIRSQVEFVFTTCFEKRHVIYQLIAV
jgi:hypothetical protein